VAALLGEPVTAGAFACLLLLAGIAVFAPWIAPYDPLTQSVLNANLQPTAAHLLGTDQFGRDVLSRIIFGARSSLLLGVISPFIAAIAGSLLGVTAGYFGGIVDRIAGRLIDLLLAFPALLLGILVAAALGPGFWELVAALAVSFAPRFARIARASTLSVRTEPFIEAAVASGVRHPRIILRHVVPNVAGPIVVVLTLWVATAIRLEATLSFLGLGTQAPQPSWGNIIRDGLNNLFGSAWPIVSAGLAITVTVLAFNLVGDAVRDALDPELRE
jgi:peptide/nickel transport system permease protein